MRNLKSPQGRNSLLTWYQLCNHIGVLLALLLCYSNTQNQIYNESEATFFQMECICRQCGKGESEKVPSLDNQNKVGVLPDKKKKKKKIFEVLVNANTTCQTQY